MNNYLALSNELKSMFCLGFSKELEMLRSQIQLQSAEISKLQLENQKLQVMVRVKKLLIFSLGTQS